MTTFRRRVFGLVLLSACLLVGRLAAGASLLSNGDFSKGTNDWPQPAGTSWEQEGDLRFLRLQSARPGQMILVYRQLVLPTPAPRALEVRLRIRYADIKLGTKNYFDGRVMFHFKDKAGKVVKPEPETPSFRGSSDGWVERKVLMKVPRGAQLLEIMPCLFQAAQGTLDLARCEVFPATLPPPVLSQTVVPAHPELLPPELHVVSNQLQTATGQAVWLQGLAVPSLEWTLTGEHLLESIKVGREQWRANVFRLPVKLGSWFGEDKKQKDRGVAYRLVVDAAIEAAASRGAYVALDLHSFGAPTEEHVEFWKDAAVRYRNHPAVLPGVLGRAETAAPGCFREPARDLPVRDDADVIVCGGGPAGIAAALAAARCGARVRLFEVHGCLGGVWTAGLLTYIFDFDKPGLTAELAGELDTRGARTFGGNKSRFVYDPEKMKVLLEELCTKAGVKMQLFTRVTAAYRDGAGKRLATIVTESNGGREAWRAPVFIDCTGDGDLGAAAGCQWSIGREKDCPCQPMTLNALIVVKDAAAMRDYISFPDGNPDFKIHEAAVVRLNRDFERAGIKPSYGRPTLFQIRGNLIEFMVNHEYGVKPFEAEKLTAATIRARAEVHRLADALRKLGGVWEGVQVVATAEQIGVRDGRRIAGRATVTREDLVAGMKQPDAVCRVTFGVDIHAESAEKNKTETISRGGVKMKPYDIPLRALIAKDVDGLMMAGRCISGDFIAHASYRVTGNSVAMGEAAGKVAALAAKTKRLPHEVDWSEVES